MSLSVTRGGRLLTLTLDRPDRGNRLDAATLRGLETALADAGGPGGADVVVLAAAGPDFCLGREPSALPVTPANLEAEFGLIQRVNELVQNSSFVTIAAVQGKTVGAGLSLAGRCDLVIAADDAVLSFPEIPHGVPPTIVLSHYAFALQRTQLRELILTGREIGPDEGQRIGLVSRVVPAAELAGAVAGLVEQLLGYQQDAVRTVKRFLRAIDGVVPARAPQLGISMYANAMVERELAARGSHDE